MGIFSATPGQPGPMRHGEFQSASIPNVVSFGFQGISPPSPLYVQRDDTLFLELISAVGFSDLINFTTRLMLPQPSVAGQPDRPGAPPSELTLGGNTIVTIQNALKGNGLGTLVLLQVPLTEGYLLSCGAIGGTGANSQRGIDFVRAFIARGAPVSPTPFTTWTLFADYVTAAQPVGWPGGRQVYPTEGAGAIVNTNPANPAAGADFTITMPTNGRVRVSTLNAQLVTSATVINRIVRVQIKNGLGNLVYQAPPQQVIPASTTAQVTFAPGQITSVVDVTTVNVPLPGPVVLGGGFTLGTSTTNLQIGDQWSNISLSSEQWLDAV